MSEITNRLVTYRDLLDHCQDYLGSSVANDAVRDSRRAIQNAYRNFSAITNWSYYYTQGRITTNASYGTGTVAYDHTGGTYERMLTLTSGTWPSWAYLGTVLIGNVSYDVADIKTSTVLTLSVNQNPGDDVASGTSYSLYRDTYAMPVDFQNTDEILIGSQLGILTYVHPSAWLTYQSYHPTPATPSFVTITSDPNYFGVMAMRLSPPPLEAYNLDFVYKRRPRQLLVFEEKAGTVSVGSATNTVTGVGTAFKDNHVGSIIRFSEIAAKYPTGQSGDCPFEIQRVVAEVTDSTHLVLDRVVPQAFTTAKYTISDPVDIEDGAMLTGFLREIEKELRIARRMKAAPGEDDRYLEAIMKAREEDSRNMGSRRVEVGPTAIGRRNLVFGRAGADIT